MSEFSTQYAILLPDGQMYLSPFSGAVVTWSTEAGAEHVCQNFRDHAASIGLEWTGTIVHRYCTPFIGPQDPAEHLVDELTAWLQQQDGAS